MANRMKRHGKKPGRNLRPSRSRYWARCGPARRKVLNYMRHHKCSLEEAIKAWENVRKRYYGETVRLSIFK
jgi:hypothetical protein